MLLITITGFSGVGKDTVAEYLASKTGWNIIRSYTTRPMRDGETNGKEHIFVNDPPTDQTSLLAYTNYGGYEYWTSWNQLFDNNVNIYIVDEKGLQDVLNAKKKGGFDVYSIAVWASLYILRQRKIESERISRDVFGRIPVSVTYNKIIKNNQSKEILYHRLDRVIEDIKARFKM